ncbi:MAG: ABC-type antimicrobial peptide transport system, ATPase component [Candidatus Moranbacteria bacterium GW2011_GWE1_35_17]|nr:MAG: ABC-type antimicrobial peptide transport system, ATPase component [Candidatus Moranbacteria bacterium GW2011_GWE1_35_17]KKP72142.1 MAG: ABC-type antimicrobial peptide transport system, ATPase component [Candidatus Moranbacteria bacterium GW2011_GWE2_35_164]KKP83980.1 MAG: ABC-type antimicrobial peptide transport system, ATPase component [Candidatus Moranbacteria bacterium GW2011_GWF2_35_54]KKP84161.1 MAG: ABC-type antimicrobial peptide transport system, ATPase component [Candidatus Moran
MSIPIIEVKNLTKTYINGEVETLALRENSFNVEKGEFVSIMGPSGSGKSTLMQMLGLLDKPSGGEYLLEGKNTRDFSDDMLAETRNSKIGFVFQTFNLLPRTSVYENVELPLLYNRNISSKINEKRITEALKSVGMEHRTDYLSNQLSGGEKQRVAIARALVTDPEIIFADEPTGNLDSKSGTQIMQILQKLNNEGKTIILVTHETFTAQHAKRILNVKDGKIISDEIVKERKIAVDGELLK